MILRVLGVGVGFGCGGSPTLVRRSLGEVGGFRGIFGATTNHRWAMDGGGWCCEASWKRDQPRVAVGGGRLVLDATGWALGKEDD
jgi:hypothetical protein